MKLICKCGKTLTKDLYHTKKWHVAESCEDYGMAGMVEIKEGSFQLSKQQRYRWFFMPSHYLVNPNDLVSKEQLEFKSGQGCCGNHFTEYNCECNTKIGYQFLDCYDDKHVILFEDKVIRKY